MEIRELRYFVALAEELHFARAAARVGIEQAPLSKAISNFERRLGVRLFVRTRRSTALTHAGETLLRDARRILAEIDDAHRNLIAVSCGRSGRLRVALGEGVAQQRLGMLFAQSRLSDPQMEVEMVHRSFSELLQGLRSGLLDVGFALRASTEEAVRSIPLWVDPPVRVMRPGQSEPNPTLFLLGERPLITSESLHGERVEYVSDVELLLTLVAAGCGVGVISAAQAETIHRSDLVLSPPDLSAQKITTHMLLRNHDASSLATRFVEWARQSAALRAWNAQELS